jgi:hypothetical protein
MDKTNASIKFTTIVFDAGDKTQNQKINGLFINRKWGGEMGDQNTSGRKGERKKRRPPGTCIALNSYDINLH